MKETLLTYETPQIDIVEVVVEQGFAVSTAGEGGQEENW